MGWVKIDDQYRSHPKIVRVGADGLALDLAGMCYSATHLTDGFVPDAAIRSLFPVRNPKGVAAELVKVGRWERDEANNGWWIHDYLDYNPSYEKIAAEREKEREKKRQQRRNPHGTYGVVPEGQPPGQPEGHNGGVPPGVPPPVPTVPSSSSSRPSGVTSVGSSSSVVPADEDEDDWPTHIAKRRLARREAEKGQVTNRRRWLGRAVQEARDEFTPPEGWERMTASEIADVLEPAPGSGSAADLTERLRRIGGGAA